MMLVNSQPDDLLKGPGVRHPVSCGQNSGWAEVHFWRNLESLVSQVCGVREENRTTGELCSFSPLNLAVFACAVGT